ncbi:hypothetical protein [Acidovorax sp. CF316]|uniref:hypothetical protein n=1 Tax=Acidovorax sp. CF316 TaxID=1144317 RepID=UPI0011B22609|nr:hypothetical protein [Acidovorax sp. CF316]
MTTSECYEVSKPELNELLTLLSQCGHVVSFFLKPKPTVLPAIDTANPLATLFALPAFQAQAAELGAIAVQPLRYSTLNKFEFEGSLVSVAVAGGCHHNTRGISQEHIRAVVAAGLNAAFPRPFDDIHVFRLDDARWCQATDEATMSTSYAAWQSARGLWWLLSIADID